MCIRCIDWSRGKGRGSSCNNSKFKPGSSSCSCCLCFVRVCCVLLASSQLPPPTLRSPPSSACDSSVLPPTDTKNNHKTTIKLTKTQSHIFLQEQHRTLFLPRRLMSFISCSCASVSRRDVSISLKRSTGDSMMSATENGSCSFCAFFSSLKSAKCNVRTCVLLGYERCCIMKE